MRDVVRDRYEAFPDPSSTTVPVGPGQLDRMDDSLHYGWSWHRYRFCYRRAEGLKILDAGCGTGLSTLALARLNPGATVVGIDASPRSLAIARERAQVAGLTGIEFHEHDLDLALPGSWGPFDFIVCRGVLSEVDDPSHVLRNLGRALDARGLLHATFASRFGKQAARQMARAVETLATPEMGLDERARLGLELFQALRIDHPIRRYEVGLAGPNVPSLERFIAVYLNESERDWNLEEVNTAIEHASLQFLFAAPRWPWQADRVLSGQAVSERLKARVAGLSDRRLAELIDALDPVLHLDEYRVYACLDDFEPRLPAWPDDRRAHPEVFNRLIPHLTGLAQPAAPPGHATAGRVAYRFVTGAPVDLDARSDLLLRAVDGQTSCGQIDQAVADQTGALENDQSRQERWLALTNSGLITLESPDLREHVDCRHLGTIRDRLDCACPRRWVRSCELHGLCTISAVGPKDEKYPALREALARLGAERVVACAECPDYSPEE